ncbi:hypothetical protein [Nocardiopsis synnemataformans]|uniref:hypothetical protein n=1 Tax=Nocardiopsis synnemataformans TaxID=61305 RepID=UPI003EC0A1C7
MGLIDGMRKKGTVDGTSSGGPEQAASPSGDSKKRTKRRKPEEMLASVVRESTVNAAIDLLSRNDLFVLPGGNSWVALALPVENIGGLSKKQQKDEAKGSLIELINHDHIQTVTTRELLDEEVLGIIPTPQTLERMGEYSLLTGATYYWMVLIPSQDRQRLLVNAVIPKATSYSEAVTISNGSRSLSDLLPQAWAWSQVIETTTGSGGTADSADVDPLTSNSTSATTPPSVLGASDESEPLATAVTAATAPDGGVNDNELEDDLLDDGEPSSQMFDEGLSPEDMAPSLSEDFGDGPGLYDDEMDDEEEEDGGGGFVTGGDEGQPPPWRHYAEQNQDRVFTEEQVRESIARRFLPDDLDLEIPFTEFEATFDVRAPSVQLKLSNSSTNWLGEQVALLAKQANAELEKLHGDHRKELRQLFVKTMSLHAESVMREVDERREGSVYHMLSAAAEEEFAGLKAKAPEEVGAQRAEITRRYEKDADERAEVAAARARQVFWDRYRPELERRIADVAPEVERRYEERYAHQRQLVLEMRRKDAHTRLQLGTTRTFQLLSEREATQREAEMELLKQWNARVTRFIDENREHDIARASALAEQLRLDNRVEEMRAEHTSRVEKLKADHENQVRRLEAELERDRERAKRRLREREEEWQSEMHTKHQQLDSANRLYTDMNAQMQSMTDGMQRQHHSRLEERDSDKRAHAEELERTNRINGRFNRLLLVLAALAVLLFTAVGIIIGWTIGYGSTGTTSAMVLPAWSL